MEPSPQTQKRKFCQSSRVHLPPGNYTYNHISLLLLQKMMVQGKAKGELKKLCTVSFQCKMLTLHI